MNAYILSIGDELVSGLTINSNAAWLAQQLTALGIHATVHLTVADQLQPITTAIIEAALRSDLLLISGGLGPTEDDLTRPALAAALGEPLVEDAPALAVLEAFFQARNRPMSPSNRLQAQRPLSASCLPNTCGTAPGLKARLGNASIYVMPGVPREMKEMFTRSVLPDLQARAGDQVTLVHKLNTFGLGESIVGEKIKDLMVRGGNPAVGTTVHDGIVSVRIYASGTRDEATAMVARTAAALRQRLGHLIFGDNEQTLESALTALLTEKQQTVATAESCTGGLLGMLLTETPGSSAAYQRGWVTYDNAAKVEDLGVPEALLAAHGAVSEPVALAMAANARTRARTDFALATTGVAGPEGGSAEKPVGLVWIALATPAGTTAYRYHFPGTRTQIRQRAAQTAIALLRWHLLGAERP